MDNSGIDNEVGSLARWLRNSCFWEALFTLSKISTECRMITQGVNGNEPIENMRLYMGYSFEKLERRLGLN